MFEKNSGSVGFWFFFLVFNIKSMKFLEVCLCFRNVLPLDLFMDSLLCMCYLSLDLKIFKIIDCKYL